MPVYEAEMVVQKATHDVRWTCFSVLISSARESLFIECGMVNNSDGPSEELFSREKRPAHLSHAGPEREMP